MFSLVKRVKSEAVGHVKMTSNCPFFYSTESNFDLLPVCLHFHSLTDVNFRSRGQ